MQYESQNTQALTALIVDDEPLAREALAGLLERYVPEVEILGQAGGVDAAAEMIDKVNPKLVFLDIEMPGKDGFKLFDYYADPPFETIFITAYDSFALKAFRYSALAYLLKPVEPDALGEAVNKAGKMLAGKISSETYQHLLEMIRRRALGKIALPTQHGLEMVKVEDIVRAEGDGSYTVFYLKDGRRLTSSRSLGYFEELLSGDWFHRAHHSHLVNLREVVAYIKGRGGRLRLSDDTEIEVATRKKNELLRKLKGED